MVVVVSAPNVPKAKVRVQIVCACSVKELIGFDDCTAKADDFDHDSIWRYSRAIV